MSRSQTKRRKSSAGKNVAIFFIVFTLLEGLIIFGLTRVFSSKDSVASLAGYSFFLMDSDNMGSQPPKDSLVIVSNGVPSADKCGYTVLAKNVEGQGTTVGWLYEVGSKGDTVDYVVYTIYQETAPDKMYDLKKEDIIGQATSYYMTAGKILSFIITPFGMAVVLAAPIVLMIIIELIIAMTRRSGDDYDYIDDEEMSDNENLTLDDFLYGGQNDDVYTSGKPKGEFEDLMEQPPQQPQKPQPKQKKPQAADKPDFSVPVSAPVPEPEPVIEQPQAAEPEPQPQPEQPMTAAPAAEDAASVDPYYYERASRMIDGVEEGEAQVSAPEAPAQTAAPAPAPTAESEPAQESRRRPEQGQPNGGQRRRPPQGGRPNGQRRRPSPQRPAAPRKDANATLEELMKLMEEEQQKLRDNHK